MSDEVKKAARTAESSRSFRLLARSGFVANGLVHILIGVIVLVVATGGDGETDQAGAFKAIADAPLGFAALWAAAVALWALGAWHAVEGILARGASAGHGEGAATVRRWGVRVSEWGQAVVFVALGVVAVTIALGARPDGDESAEGASRGILSVPGGAFLLGAIGLGIGIGGVAFVVMGVMRSFRKKMTIPQGAAGRGIEVLGAVGFVAKGVALGIVGVLLLIAAIRVEPDAAGGLDGAVEALLALPLGPVLAGVVGAGFIAYGLFCLFRARYARL